MLREGPGDRANSEAPKHQPPGPVRSFCRKFSAGSVRMNTIAGLKIWHPFTQAHADPDPIRVVRAQGIYLYTDDGRQIIDAISSWWVNLHGHCHPRIVAAVAAQAAALDHVLLAGFSHPTVEQLTRKLRN